MSGFPRLPLKIELKKEEGRNRRYGRQRVLLLLVFCMNMYIRGLLA